MQRAMADERKLLVRVSSQTTNTPSRALRTPAGRGARSAARTQLRLAGVA